MSHFNKIAEDIDKFCFQLREANLNKFDNVGTITAVEELQVQDELSHFWQGFGFRSAPTA
jgi:hypothetical protein